jgi:hypothetical protein
MCRRAGVLLVSVAAASVMLQVQCSPDMSSALVVPSARWGQFTDAFQLSRLGEFLPAGGYDRDVAPQGPANLDNHFSDVTFFGVDQPAGPQFWHSLY